EFHRPGKKTYYITRAYAQSAGRCDHRGSRRAGKSRLVAEHARRVNRRLIRIEGIRPRAAMPAQLAAFAVDLSAAGGIPVLGLENWNAAFRTLGTLAKGRQWIILFDEITGLAPQASSVSRNLR